MEGVAYNLRWLKESVESFARCRFEQLNFVGGAALSATWCQILADVLGCRVGQVANPRYANAVGTALAGFAALGELDPEEIPAAVELAAGFDPDPAAQRIHDRQFEHFLRLYRGNRALYRRMNG
jgi:sugar (pentulose or hexulose) kinase